MIEFFEVEVWLVSWVELGVEFWGLGGVLRGVGVLWREDVLRLWLEVGGFWGWFVVVGYLF